MDNIIEPTMDYDFSKLYFGPPSTLAGGAYFARIMYGTNKPLFIQTPKCLTKQGFIKSGKKVYTDLMFDNNDTIFINWIENLETRCQELIYSKRESWFETKLEKDDIESAFTSSFKIFKSGKYYLLRVNVKPNIKIYDENDQIITTDSITNDKSIISILEIQGLKFTSRNFQMEIELKQSMVVSPDPFLDECFIKKPNKKQVQKEEEEEEEQEKKDDEGKENVNLDKLIEKSVKVLQSLEKPLKEEPIDLDVSFPKQEKEEEKRKKEIDLDLEEATIEIDVEEPKEEKEEEKEKEKEEKEDSAFLKEVDLSSTIDNNLETIQLKKPNQVYYEIYQKAREKAKEAKKTAILAFLEMKNIKKTYMLDDIDESDSDFDEKDSDFDDEDIDIDN
jgi:hypothetical protein